MSEALIATLTKFERFEDLLSKTHMYKTSKIALISRLVEYQTPAHKHLADISLKPEQDSLETDIFWILLAYKEL